MRKNSKVVFIIDLVGVTVNFSYQGLNIKFAIFSYFYLEIVTLIKDMYVYLESIPLIKDQRRSSQAQHIFMTGISKNKLSIGQNV